MVKVIYIPKGTALKGKNLLPVGAYSFAPCGSKFFPLIEVPIMKRDTIKRITV